MNYADIATPHVLRNDPRLAWGFHGHQMLLYRQTVPHEGFSLLRRLGDSKPQGCFVVTSNIDGHFFKRGFHADQVHEIHGSMQYLQCVEGCLGELWRADDFVPEVDVEACLLRNDPPTCPHCGSIARPNLQLFADYHWVEHRACLQQARFEAWRQRSKRFVTLEFGAGTVIPSIRRLGEKLDAPLVRINLHEPAVFRAQDLPVEMRALEAIRELLACLADTRLGRANGTSRP